MRMPRFRITIRRMIIVVALAALIINVEVMRRFRAHCQREAFYHRVLCQKYDRELEQAEEFLQILPPNSLPNQTGFASSIVFKIGLPPRTFTMSDVNRLQRLVIYHDLMRRKYELAANRPWRSLTPDPPEPKQD